eukprot:CAMPEP_0175877818 /NCGR_PEP_ID=MMETSP0107_2-20121207/40836_1 /TAXON_ID=195067 ORGANISM="Goniomonas pacifica, Strain CCMP1869" /NCGR_SAMPLE_ID=MMETSP0107_2 /ASSEMBLY_ACC=CAM_ASM_000203 /LENGTH=108 /DNA_ID=CAMNT_0017197219 /DNA_START=1033 /DNA_END=1360 /DNA_ORIENTATION=-
MTDRTATHSHHTGGSLRSSSTEASQSQVDLASWIEQRCNTGWDCIELEFVVVLHKVSEDISIFGLRNCWAAGHHSIRPEDVDESGNVAISLTGQRVFEDDDGGWGQDL